MTRIFLFILSVLFTTGIAARTIVVDKNGTVRSIRMALEMAKENDTILVHNAIYKEGNIAVNKSVVLLGENFPIIDGIRKFEILTISGKNITIRGFLFRNSGTSSIDDYAAVKVKDSKNVIIENNKLVNSFFGIHFSNSTFITIRNNTIAGTPANEHTSGNGIHLWKCDNAIIENNNISGHRDGIYFEFVNGSTIRNNTSEKNIRYGLHFMFSHNNAYLNNTFKNNGAGVAVMYSKQVRMEKNRFEQNWGPSAYGILLKEITDSYIQNNVFLKNTTAIHMEGSNRIEIQKNIFKENGWAIKVQASCADNRFVNNNFFGNSFDVATNGTMVLNEFNNNYWDKYEGYDLDKNGIGDVPYHPVSMYSMIVEQNPNALILLKSFIVSLLDKAEKAIPSLTPENLADKNPVMKPFKL